MLIRRSGVESEFPVIVESKPVCFHFTGKRTPNRGDVCDD